MSKFDAQYAALLQEFNQHKHMVLSTSLSDCVTSRMMSVVEFGGKFYFQTDATLRKYQQLSANPNIALCADNLQIEGICREIGHPLQNEAFCALYKKHFLGSYRAYTAMQTERLFEVTPIFIQRWVYEDAQPCIERFWVETQTHETQRYFG